MLASLCAIQGANQNKDQQKEEAWKSWKAMHGRKYKSEKEEGER